MGNKCCCVNTITSTEVTVSTTEITITIPQTTFIPGHKYRFYVPQQISEGAAGLPVFIDNGGTTIPLWTCGEAQSVRGFQLRVLRMEQCCNIQHCIPCEFVSTGISQNPDHFTVTRRLPCTTV